MISAQFACTYYLNIIKLGVLLNLSLNATFHVFDAGRADRETFGNRMAIILSMAYQSIYIYIYMK